LAPAAGAPRPQRADPVPDQVRHALPPVHDGPPDGGRGPQHRQLVLSSAGRIGKAVPRKLARPRSASALGPAFFPAPVRFPTAGRRLTLPPELVVADAGPFVDTAVGRIEDGTQVPGMG